MWRNRDTTQNFSLSPCLYSSYLHPLLVEHTHTHTSHLGVTKCKCESTSAAGVHISFLERYAAYGALIPGSSFFASRWKTGGPAKARTTKQVCSCKCIIYHKIAKYVSKTKFWQLKQQLKTTNKSQIWNVWSVISLLFRAKWIETLNQDSNSDHLKHCCATWQRAADKAIHSFQFSCSMTSFSFANHIFIRISGGKKSLWIHN